MPSMIETRDHRRYENRRPCRPHRIHRLVVRTENRFRRAVRGTCWGFRQWGGG